MSAVEIISIAASISLLAGWRLYLCIFAVGLGMRLGWIAMPGHLQSLDALASYWVLGIAGAGEIVEFFADKISWLDSAWDMVHTLVRPVGGALLALAVVDAGNPVRQRGAVLARRRAVVIATSPCVAPTSMVWNSDTGTGSTNARVIDDTVHRSIED